MQNPRPMRSRYLECHSFSTQWACRDTKRSVFTMKHWENKLMIAACAIGFVLQFAVTEVPFFISAFGTSHLDGTGVAPFEPAGRLSAFSP